MIPISVHVAKRKYDGQFNVWGLLPDPGCTAEAIAANERVPGYLWQILAVFPNRHDASIFANKHRSASNAGNNLSQT